VPQIGKGPDERLDGAMNKENTTGMNTYQGVNRQLKKLFPDLPRALKVVATYMLEHPGDIATLSMRQVAANSGVSLPNFARLAKLLGYDTYGDLREIYRKQVQQSDINEYHLRAENLQQSGGNQAARDVWEGFRNSTLDNLSAVFDAIDPEYFASVAQVLNDARNVYIVGMQASAAFSAYAHYIGLMASGKFRLVRGEGGVFADPVADLGPEDVMISISQQPCARAAVELAMIARDRGAKVIAMDGYLTKEVVAKVQRIINDKEYRDEMVDYNFEIGKAFFSYSVLRRKLRALVTNFTGQDNL